MAYGIGVLAGISLANITLASIGQYFKISVVKYQDERLALTQDVIAGIKPIKFLNWERIFERKINTFRSLEFKYTKYIRYIDALVNFFWRSLSFALMYIFLSSPEGDRKSGNLYSVIL